MRRGGIDIHPRDYAAYVGAKKDRTWGSVVQLHAFAAVYDIDVNVWTRESAMATFASSARWRRIINTRPRFHLNARGAKCRADNRLGNARHFASELRMSRKEATLLRPQLFKYASEQSAAPISRKRNARHFASVARMSWIEAPAYNSNNAIIGIE